MTPRQNRALGRIAWAALDRLPNLELKEWFIKPLRDGSPILWVTVETGAPGDEGTMAAVLCRYRGSFMVGPRGKITSAETLSGDKARARNAKKHPLIYGFTS